MTMDIGTADYSELPDYTDPGDSRRLRIVHRGGPDHRWGADDDRNSGQEATLGILYARMDDLVTRGPDVPYGWDEGDYAAVLAAIAETWTAIRAIIGGGK